MLSADALHSRFRLQYSLAEYSSRQHSWVMENTERPFISRQIFISLMPELLRSKGKTEPAWPWFLWFYLLGLYPDSCGYLGWASAVWGHCSEEQRDTHVGPPGQGTSSDGLLTWTHCWLLLSQLQSWCSPSELCGCSLPTPTNCRGQLIFEGLPGTVGVTTGRADEAVTLRCQHSEGFLDFFPFVAYWGLVL